MTTDQIAALASALLGIAGTVMLYRGTYGVEPLGGSPWGGPVLEAANAKISQANLTRRRRQRIGLGLLLASFTVQAVAAIL